MKFISLFIAFLVRVAEDRCDARRDSQLQMGVHCTALAKASLPSNFVLI